MNPMYDIYIYISKVRQRQADRSDGRQVSTLIIYLCPYNDLPTRQPADLPTSQPVYPPTVHVYLSTSLIFNLLRNYIIAENKFNDIPTPFYF